MAYSLAHVYFLSCSKPYAALRFISLFTSISNVKSRSQNVCPVDIQDTKDSCHLIGLNCIYLFGVKSLYPVVVRKIQFGLSFSLQKYSFSCLCGEHCCMVRIWLRLY